MTVAQRIKLSETTLSILKNFSGINSNILIKPGNILKTLSPMKNIMAEASIEESFDREIAIWDLNQFLGTISLFSDPEFEFEEKYVNIYGSNGASVRYHYSAPNLVTNVTKSLDMPEVVVNFDLEQRQLQEIQRAASVLGLPDLSVVSNGDQMELLASDKKVASSNSFSIDLGALPSSDDFCFNFRVDNLKLIGGDYEVSIAKSVISRFIHKSIDVTYFIALESDSTYNG